MAIAARTTSCFMAFLALSGPAHADEPAATTVQPSAPPPAPPPAGLTLPSGAFNALVTTEVNLASDSAAEPWSIAPDLGYGVTDDLTLMLVHSTYATTGFRGSAGSGLCLAAMTAAAPGPTATSAARRTSASCAGSSRWLRSAASTPPSVRTWRATT